MRREVLTGLGAGLLGGLLGASSVLAIQASFASRFMKQADELKLAVQGGTGNRTKPIVEITSDEAFSNPPGSFFGSILAADYVDRGSTGNRGGIGSFVIVQDGHVGSFYTPFGGVGRLKGGAGAMFGGNPVSICEKTVAAEAQCSGEEIDVQTESAIDSKVGAQIADLSTVDGRGTSTDAGLLFLRGDKSRGFSHGILFGQPHTSYFPIVQHGDLLSTIDLDSSTPLESGIDLSNISTFDKSPLLLRPGVRGIWWGKAHEGGSVVSETRNDGGELVFSSGEILFRFEGRTTAGVSAKGLFAATGVVNQALPQTPQTSNSPCIRGDQQWDEHFEYRCVEKDRWRRTPNSIF